MANLLKYKFHALFVVIFVTLSVYLYLGHYNKPPISTHAWAQSDRLAICYGFLDNGFNLFKPETYCLNVQYPSKKAITKPRGITQVDFPINEYIIAALMKTANNFTPSVFRLYTLLYSLFGLYFLFLLFYSQKNSFFACLTISLFAFSSPVYSYYQIGLIPSIPAIANIFIACYFFFNYLQLKSNKYLICSVLFFTLATLTRLPLGIYFISAFLFLMLNWFRSKKINLIPLFTFLIGFLIVIIYFIYNTKLKNEYGSVFLTQVLPPKNQNEFLIVWDAITSYRYKQYFSELHYYVLILLLVTGLILVIKKLIQLNSFQYQLLTYILISLSGATLYSLLMFKQFKDHDYYFLDSFFIVFVLLLGFIVSMIISYGKIKTILIYGLLIISIFLIANTHRFLNEHFSIMPWDNISKSIVEIIGSDKLLDSLKIKKEATLFILDNNNVSNVQLIHFKRKGFSFPFAEWDGTAREKITNTDYTITINKLFTKQLDSNYRVTLNHLDTFFVNKKLTIYKKP